MVEEMVFTFLHLLSEVLPAEWDGGNREQHMANLFCLRSLWAVEIAL